MNLVTFLTTARLGKVHCRSLDSTVVSEGNVSKPRRQWWAGSLQVSVRNASRSLSPSPPPSCSWRQKALPGTVPHGCLKVQVHISHSPSAHYCGRRGRKAGGPASPQPLGALPGPLPTPSAEPQPPSQVRTPYIQAASPGPVGPYVRTLSQQQAEGLSSSLTDPCGALPACIVKQKPCHTAARVPACPGQHGHAAGTAHIPARADTRHCAHHLPGCEREGVCASVCVPVSISV